MKHYCATNVLCFSKLRFNKGKKGRTINNLFFQSLKSIMKPRNLFYKKNKTTHQEQQKASIDHQASRAVYIPDLL